MVQNNERASAHDAGDSPEAVANTGRPPTSGRLLPRAIQKQIRRPDRAERVIQFIECLTVPSGVGQGGNFNLLDFEKEFIRDIYTLHDLAGKQLVRRAVLSIARKNGKTALMACLALVHLIGPEAIHNGEIYSAANDREQAAQVFKVAAQIVRADPELAVKLKIVDSTKTIVNYGNGSLYKAISSEAGTKHGLNPSVVIFDELAQAKGRALYDVLDTAMGAREEPLFIVISTQSNDPEHLLSKLIDDGLSEADPTICCHLHAVPDEEENIFDDEEVWKLANPALGHFRNLDDFRALAAKAARMPSEEAKYRNLYLNQRVSPISALIPKREWDACKGNAEFINGEEVYLGLDLSSVNDLSALAMVSAKNKSRVRVWCWKPEHWLAEHSNRDFGHNNHRYVLWAKQGFMETTPGKVIDHIVIAKHIAELTKQYKVLGMAFDRYKMEYLMRDFDAIDFAVHEEKENKEGQGLKLVPWGQGFVSMAPAVDEFEKAVSSRELVHDSNPVLNWNISNAVAIMDPAGGRKLDKDAARFRIDGAVALVMALGLKGRNKVPPVKEYKILVI